MNTTQDIAQARKTYAALRAAAVATGKITKAAFDELAGHFAHEHADGEEIEPSDWTMGAREAVWEATGDAELCQIA